MKKQFVQNDNNMAVAYYRFSSHAQNEHISHMLSDKRKKYVIRSLRKGETELLKWQGFEKASLAVQKANYAVKMYEFAGVKPDSIR